MATQNRKFLIFSLQDSLYALDLAQVAEVGDPPPMSPIPLAPAYYRGAVNFHGNIVPVMNLSFFLDLAEDSHPGKIIVLHQEVASLAFLVDTTVRIISEEEVSFGKPPEMCLTTATLRIADGDVILLDIEALVRLAESSMQENQ